MILDRLLEQLRARGLRVTGPNDGEPDDTLHLVGSAAERTPQVMAALARFKPDLVAKYGRRPVVPSGPPYGSPESDSPDSYSGVPEGERLPRL